MLPPSYPNPIVAIPPGKQFPILQKSWLVDYGNGLILKDRRGRNPLAF
jgi:hypothetical protein